MDDNIRKRNLDILVDNGGFQFSDTFFPYTSGQIGPYFVQSAVVMDRGRDYSQVILDMTNLVYEIDGEKETRDDFVISGGETRDWIFSNPVASNIEVPHASIYKDGKIIGANMDEREVYHVADLNNEGSSPRDLWVPAIKKAGGKIENIFFYVDRMEDGVQVMNDLGLRSHCLVPLDGSSWNYLKDEGVFSEKAYINLMERMEDKDAWAVKMLRSESGLETLGRLFSGSNKDRGKAHKILDVGYPDLSLELKERLTERGIQIKAE